MSIMRDVALKKTLQDYCDNRDAVRNLYAHGRKAISDAEKLANETLRYGITGNAHPRDSIEEVFRSMDGRYWADALDLTKLSTIMDAKAMKVFRDSLGTKEMPEFTMDNVEATFLEMYQSRDEMFSRGCWEVFRSIKPGRWVSNDKEPYSIPKGRIVLEWWFESSKWSTYPRTNYSKSDTIKDVDRIFRVLDGKQPHPRGFESELNDFFKNNPTDRFENEYFKVRAFANGNAHIWFRRGDLVDKLNGVIAEYCGPALPDVGQSSRHTNRPTSAYEGAVPHGSV